MNARHVLVTGASPDNENRNTILRDYVAEGFREVLGVSAARYLRAVRLNNARRDLKDPSAAANSVQDVAARWGFWHLGQFSVDYKRQFGELPSATLRAARARA